MKKKGGSWKSAGKYFVVFVLGIFFTLAITNGFTLIQSTVNNAVQFIKQTVFTDSGLDTGTRLMDINATSGYIWINTGSLTNGTGFNLKFLALDTSGNIIYAPELDPLFSASPASGITTGDINLRNSGATFVTTNLTGLTTLVDNVTGVFQNWYLTGMYFNSGNNLLTLYVSGYGPVTGYIVFTGMANWNTAYSRVTNTGININSLATTTGLNCSTGEIAKYDGTARVCSGDLQGVIGDMLWTGDGIVLRPVQAGEVKFQVGQGASVIGTGSTAIGYGASADGEYAISIGYQSTGYGNYSIAMGRATSANGRASTTMGYGTIANGGNSTAMGETTIASGDSSTAMGVSTIAIGNWSTTMGYHTTGAGIASTAIGYATTANGWASTAMGWGTTSIGVASVAMGISTTANGTGSTAMGDHTNAIGNYSTAMGWSTHAVGNYSTAMGYATTGFGQFSTAMGANTTASGNYSTAIGVSTIANGDYSTAMGLGTTAQGIYSTAMGENTYAGGSVSTAMGLSSHASGSYSTAIGDNTHAIGSASTAMGSYSTANGISSTAMGSYSTASGDYSTAMGRRTIANGIGSTTMGYYTITHSSANYSLAIGLYNVGYSNSLFEIGMGINSTTDSGNALTVRNNGAISIGTGALIPSAKLTVDGGIKPKSVTSDPCADTTNYPAGTIFYDPGGEFYCFCNGASVAKKVQDPATTCSPFAYGPCSPSYPGYPTGC